MPRFSRFQEPHLPSCLIQVKYRLSGRGVLTDLICEKQQRHNDRDDANDFQHYLAISLARLLSPTSAPDLFPMHQTDVFICFSTGAVSGHTPRHMRKDSAACSTSMPQPMMDFAAPCSRAHSQKGVGSRL